MVWLCSKQKWHQGTYTGDPVFRNKMARWKSCPNGWNKLDIAALFPPTSKKETSFLRWCGVLRSAHPELQSDFWPSLSRNWEENQFQMGLWATARIWINSVGDNSLFISVNNVFYTAAGDDGLSWSLWQKVAREAQGWPLGLWSWTYRGSEACYSLAEKEILEAYEGFQAALEVMGTEVQLLLAPWLPTLGWTAKGRVSSANHAANATDAAWSEPHRSHSELR